jgi:hypothetical protein
LGGTQTNARLEQSEFCGTSSCTRLRQSQSRRKDGEGCDVVQGKISRPVIVFFERTGTKKFRLAFEFLRAIERGFSVMLAPIARQQASAYFRFPSLRRALAPPPMVYGCRVRPVARGSI